MRERVRELEARVDQPAAAAARIAEARAKEVEAQARLTEAENVRRRQQAEALRPPPRPAPSGPRMDDTISWEPIPQVAEQSAEAGDQGQRLPRDDTNKSQDD